MVRKLLLLLSSNNREDFIHQSCRSNRPTGCFSGEAAVPGVATRCQCWLRGEKTVPQVPAALGNFRYFLVCFFLSQKHRQSPGRRPSFFLTPIPTLGVRSAAQPSAPPGTLRITSRPALFQTLKRASCCSVKPGSLILNLSLDCLSSSLIVSEPATAGKPLKSSV